MLGEFSDHWQGQFARLKDAKILIAFSGGPDSTALLDMLSKSGTRVAAAHFNHQMAPEAEQQADHCHEFCRSRGIELTTGTANVPQVARETGKGLEETARHLRYNFLRQAAYQSDCSAIATGHNRNDQAETLLLNMVRGSGLRGLAGIHPDRDGIVRPMLIFGRVQIENYVAAEGLAVFLDPSNLRLDAARNRIRHVVLPELGRLNGKAVEHIAAVTDMARAEDQYLDGLAAHVLEGLELSPNGDLSFLTSNLECVLDRPGLAKVPTVLVARAVRLCFNLLGAAADAAQTGLAVQAIVRGEPVSVTAEGGDVVCEVDEATVHFRHLLPAEPFRFPVTNPGETASELFGWQIVAHSGDPHDFQRDRGSLEVVLDAGAVQGGLHLRSAAEGDKMTPLGMDGTKSVADLLADAKLTLTARRVLPIICDMAGPVWVPGVHLADRVKVTSGTTQGLVLRLEPVSHPATS